MSQADFHWTSKDPWLRSKGGVRGAQPVKGREKPGVGCRYFVLVADVRAVDVLGPC
jgi:hypothetical protein